MSGSPGGAAAARRQRTSMLLADGTPKAAGANATRIEHSRTAMLMADKSVADPDDDGNEGNDGTQSTGSLVSFVQEKVKGLVESVRHRS